MRLIRKTDKHVVKTAKIIIQNNTKIITTINIIQIISSNKNCLIVLN